VYSEQFLADSMIVNSYKDLKVWQKSIELVTEIYKLTEQFPKSEIYGLASQMQRAAVAIPSTIQDMIMARVDSAWVCWVEFWSILLSSLEMTALSSDTSGLVLGWLLATIWAISLIALVIITPRLVIEFWSMFSSPFSIFAN